MNHIARTLTGGLILGLFIGFAGGTAAAADYSDQEYQFSGSALLDAVNHDYPPDTSGTVNDPRILQPLRRHESATELLDRIDKYYPSTPYHGTWDLRIPYSTSGDESATDTLDIINELYPVFD